MKHEHIVKSVENESIAKELEIEAGDVILAINNQEIEDIFDYQYLINDEYIELLVRKPDGEEWLLEIEKDYDEDLGIEFENSLMDDYKSCHNQCIFCFIDQNPKGMRDTIYFKDDDSRLSFLQGNYITLTKYEGKGCGTNHSLSSGTDQYIRSCNKSKAALQDAEQQICRNDIRQNQKIL